MFTSRAEYRLLLREDNADFRLRDIGHRLGLVSDEVYRDFTHKRDQVDSALGRLEEFRLRPQPGVNDRLKELGSSPIKDIISLTQLLKRSEILFSHVAQFDPGISDIPEEIMREGETRLKYEGYIERQEQQVDKLKRMEEIKLPEAINYAKIHGLSTEVKEKLSKVRPISLGQASRISGVTPAALMAIQVHLKRFGSLLANTPDRAFS